MSTAETNLSDPNDVGDLNQFGYRQSLRRTLGPYGSFAIAFSMISITTAIFFLLPSLFGTAGAVGVWLWIPCAAGVFLTKARSNLLLDDQVEDRPNLLVQIALNAVSIDHVSPEIPEARSHASRARAIASAMRFHCAVSSPSCRRPALVSV